jgi:zinc D-Ala-D-Ala carboxypeptidase
MKYFNYSEFDSPDVQGSGQMMDDKILMMLDQVRDKFDKPIHITSGFRTPQHNEDVGGKMPDENGNGGSSHLKGLAVDIFCNKSVDRFDLINCLLDVGFSRIGVADTFIHADIDPDKVQGVMWTY